MQRCSKDTVPDAQGSAEIDGLCGWTRLARVMPVVKYRRNKKASQGTERPGYIGMRQHRRKSDHGVSCDNCLEGKANQEEQAGDQRSVNHLADRMKPQCRKPINVLARVVHEMKTPKEWNVMVRAVYPIRQKIDQQKRDHDLDDQGDRPRRCPHFDEPIPHVLTRQRICK